MAEIDRLEERIVQLEIQIRTLNVARVLLQAERTYGCTNGCTGACPDPTGNCTYGCTNGCTQGCTDGCGERLQFDLDAVSTAATADHLTPSEAEDKPRSRPRQRRNP